MLHRELLINGHLIGGPCDQSVGKDQVYSPYDGRLIGTVAEGGWSEMDACLDSAVSAFETFRRSSVAERSALLLRIAQAVRERADELAQILVDEIGKPRSYALAEVNRLAVTFELASREVVEHDRRPCDVGSDQRAIQFETYLRRVPVGPVFCIVPYNWPYNLAAHKIAPALAAGCTVVMKAPVIGALATLTLAQLIHEAGCPAGVLNVIHCANPIAERAVKDDRIAMLSFTGSMKVGWMLKGLIPQKRVTLELGGDAFAVVCADAQVDDAVAKCVSGGYAYAGQICISIQHVLCATNLYEEFREKLTKAVEECPYGDPGEDGVVCGPLVNDATAERVMTWIEEAEAAGAKVLCGGNRVGRLVTPTLIEDVPFETKLGHEEVFGPVVTLSKFENDQDAIDRVNRSSYGIHCGVFTSDPNRMALFEDSMQVCGVVFGDGPNVRFDALPYGGEKQSGFGREGVRYAIDSMTTEKSTAVRKI